MHKWGIIDNNNTQESLCKQLVVIKWLLTLGKFHKKINTTMRENIKILLIQCGYVYSCLHNTEHYKQYETSYGRRIKMNNFCDITHSEFIENDYFLVKYCINNHIHQDTNILFDIINNNIVLANELKHKLLNYHHRISLRTYVILKISIIIPKIQISRNIPHHMLLDIACCK